jgi:hypothetical protein
MTDPACSPTQLPASSSPQTGVGPPPRLSLGGNDIDVRSSDQHTGSVSSTDGGAALANQKNWFASTRDRLRGRTVPRWAGKGAAGALVATGVGGGIATGIAVAAGKGAAIGAAFGSVIPGVGTVGGALIGGAIGALVAAGIGGGIGFLAAGGRSRDKAEQAIDSLRGEGLITAREAENLKARSNRHLQALCGIPRGARLPDADQEAFRKLLLLTDVAVGQEASHALQGEVLNYASSGKAGTVARNLLAVLACLERDQSRQPLDDGQQQEVLRYMHDEATRRARQGTTLRPGDAQRQADADELLSEAQRRAGAIPSQDLAGIGRCRDEAVEEMGALLDELQRGQRTLQRVVGRLLEVNDRLQMMRGYEVQAGQAQEIGVHAENVAAEAIAGSTAYPNDLLEKALAPGGVLRTVVLGAQACQAQAAEQQRATALVEGAQRLVRMLGEIGGPATGRLEADQAVLRSAWPGAQVDQAGVLVERAILGLLTDDDNLDSGDQAPEIAEWAVDAGLASRFGVIGDIERALLRTGDMFGPAFATVSGRLEGDDAVLPPGMMDRLQRARAGGDEAEMKELLRLCRDSLKLSIPEDKFSAWQQQLAQGREPDAGHSSDDGSDV